MSSQEDLESALSSIDEEDRAAQEEFVSMEEELSKMIEKAGNIEDELRDIRARMEGEGFEGLKSKLQRIRKDIDGAERSLSEGNNPDDLASDLFSTIHSATDEAGDIENRATLQAIENDLSLMAQEVQKLESLREDFENKTGEEFDRLLDIRRKIKRYI